MPVAPFVPLIASGIGLVTGRPKGKGKAEQGLSRQQEAAASQQAQQGRQAFSFGMPLLQRSGSYYDTILKGNRGAIQAAMAPEINAIGDINKGANLSLERSGLRGATKDMAQAELSRQKAGQIGGLVLNARPQAAAQAAALGQVGINAGMGATATSGGLYGDLARGAAQERQYQDQRMGEYGNAVGGFITDLLRNVPWNKNSGIPTIGSPQVNPVGF